MIPSKEVIVPAIANPLEPVDLNMPTIPRMKPTVPGTKPKQQHIVKEQIPRINDTIEITCIGSVSCRCGV